MKKLMFALAAVIALTAFSGTASAQVIASGPSGGCATCAQGGQGYADYGPAYGPSYGPSAGGHLHNGMYGLNPGFDRLLTPHKRFINKIAFPEGKHGGNDGYGGYGGGMGGPFGRGRGGPGGGGNGGPYGPNGPTGPTMEAAQGGTLVFPQNPYIRSPRDFFMWDAK